MSSSLDTLFHMLLSYTVELEKCVIQSESDPNNWVELLESRQKIIDELDPHLRHDMMEERHLKNIRKIYEIDQKIMPLMQEKQGQTRAKLGEINQLKVASNRYNPYNGATAYGAFFDKKK